MYLYLLETNVSVDVNKLSNEQFLILCSFVLVLFAIIFINGFSIKLGDKEFNIGGIMRLLVKKDEDTMLKEKLHRFSEEVDHEINGNLYDLVDSLNYEIEGFAMKEHCYFTHEKFISTVKTELEKRVRRNNLKDKLSIKNREKYVESMLKDIESRYELLHAKVSLLKCGEAYAHVSVIKNAIRKILYQFFDGANKILIEGCEKKIKEYNKEKGNFKTKAARKFSCEITIEKNTGYIQALRGN